MAGAAPRRVHPGGAGGLAVLLLALAGCVTTPGVEQDAGTTALAPGERIVMPPALPGRSFASVPVATVQAVTPRPLEAAPAPVVAPPAEVVPVVAAPVVAPAPVALPVAEVVPAVAPVVVAPASVALPVTEVAPVAAAVPPPIRQAPEPPPAGAARGGVRVQLVAAGSEAEAMQHWARFAARAPDLAESRTPLVQRLDREGQAPIFRLRVGGFAGAEEAARWCATLRERQIACWVAG